MNDEMMYENSEQSSVAPEVKYLQTVFAPNGWGTKLMTPITRVQILPERVAMAFKNYLDSVQVGETFTMIELLTTPEMLFNRMEVVAKEGYAVYMLDEGVTDPHLRDSLMRNSVPGLCGLLLATHGVELYLPMGKTLEQVATSRLLILREKDGERFCRTDIVKMVRIGSVCEGRLRVKRDNVTLCDFALTELLPTESAELQLWDNAAEPFEEAFAGALATRCCVLQPGKYFVDLSSDLSIEHFFAGCLGLFSAMMRYRFALPMMRFAPNGRIGLVVPRPQISAGDRVYAFRPQCGADNRPLPGELTKMNRFLATAYHEGKIKSVLPLKKNALDTMNRLGGEELSYLPEREFPTDCFAVLAILPSGADAPATRLGEFQFR